MIIYCLECRICILKRVNIHWLGRAMNFECTFTRTEEEKKKIMKIYHMPFIPCQGQLLELKTRAQKHCNLKMANKTNIQKG